MIRWLIYGAPLLCLAAYALFDALSPCDGLFDAYCTHDWTADAGVLALVAFALSLSPALALASLDLASAGHRLWKRRRRTPGAHQQTKSTA